MREQERFELGEGEDPFADPVERPITEVEGKAIASLQRLARTWPRSLMLASMGGTLVVIPTADHEGVDGGVDPAKVIATIPRIPNTGGDW